MKQGEKGFFINWPEAFSAGAEVVGGKGWNLARLERYGFMIPSGGVLIAKAYQVFIDENNLLAAIEKISQSVNIENIGEEESEKELFLLREKIKAGLFPAYMQDELISSLTKINIFDKPVAVRSSATCEDSARASFAGMHDSFLNIRGTDNIILAVKECYASLWTPRALAYRRKMGFDDNQVNPAAVVMEMVEPLAAGVGFTCDPQTGREDVVLINANFGLGESVVSGCVQPDEYRLDAENEIIQLKIGRKEYKTIACANGGTSWIDSPESSKKQVLSQEHIKRLSLIIQRVYDALGNGEQHQDVEWVFNGTDFILVQARPVTTLPRYTFARIKNQPDIWSNANLRDALPMVQSTLNWSRVKQSQGVDLGKLVGFPTPPGLQQMKRFWGRAYSNLSLQQWILYDAFGMMPGQINEAQGGHQPEIEIAPDQAHRIIKRFKRIWWVVKLIQFIRRISGSSEAAFKKVDEFVDACVHKDLVNLSDNDLIASMTAITDMLDEFSPIFFACNMAANMMPLIKTLEKNFPGRGKALANALMIGQGDITSAQHGYRLVELAEIAGQDAAARNYFSREGFDPLAWEMELPDESRFKQLFQAFLADYGDRGVYEMDICNPRWREDPSYLLHIVKNTMATANLKEFKTRQKVKADQIWQEIKPGTPPSRYRKIKRLVKQAVKGMELRKMAKYDLVKLYGALRIISLQIGRSLQDRGILAAETDVFHCSWTELFSVLKGDWNGKGLKVLVMERKAWQQKMEELAPPDYFVDETPHFEESSPNASGEVLKGLGVSAGRASGPAKLMDHPSQEAKLHRGDVLVARSADPGWTPLFLRAAAIIVETGGAGSHGAIVAREYGIPTVMNIPGIMQIIKDGQNIVVDGDEGKVFLN